MCNGCANGSQGVKANKSFVINELARSGIVRLSRASSGPHGVDDLFIYMNINGLHEIDDAQPVVIESLW